jgi:hypothetical protein
MCAEVPGERVEVDLARHRCRCRHRLCHRGRLLRRGLRVIAVDQSPAMLEQMRSRLGADAPVRYVPPTVTTSRSRTPAPTTCSRTCTCTTPSRPPGHRGDGPRPEPGRQAGHHRSSTATTTTGCSLSTTTGGPALNAATCSCTEHTLVHMSIGAAIAVGAVVGLALGIVVSVTTDVPFAPEAGLLLGALVGWFSRRKGA